MSNRERILAFITEYIAERCYSPSIREIAAGVGCSSSTVHHHLHMLVRMKQLAWEPGKQRTLRVVA